MSNEMKMLLDAARQAEFTQQQKEDQRRSFAYGNTKIENSRITRELIDREADSLAKKNE